MYFTDSISIKLDETDSVFDIKLQITLNMIMILQFAIITSYYSQVIVVNSLSTQFCPKRNKTIFVHMLKCFLTPS